MSISLRFILPVLLFPLVSSGQKHLLKLDIHSPIFRTGILSYEYVLDENSSLSLGVLYSDRTSEMSNSDYLTRLAITPEFRYYLQSDPAPQGLFVSGALRYQWMRSERTESEWYYDQFGNYVSTVPNYSLKEISTFGLAVAVGYQRVFKERVSVEGFIGPAWNSGDKRRDLRVPGSTDPNERFQPYVGYFIRTGVSIGFAF